jgi:sarcosine oxidase
VPFQELSAADVSQRWPVLQLPLGTRAVHQADTAIVPAARATAVLQRLARREGAVLVDQSPVTALVDHGESWVEVHCGDTSYRARHVVLTADAWTNHLLAHLGTSLPLTVTQEQVTYFAPPEPDRFAPARLPVWIWMDDPSFYGFPSYGEATVKAGQDCGGAVVTADSRSFEADDAVVTRLHEFVSTVLPGCGSPVRTSTCLYTLTPDRDFVVGPVPGHPAVLVGLGAGHGFKFAPTLGRILADLATTGSSTSDISAFGLGRAALVDTDHPVSWLV